VALRVLVGLGLESSKQAFWLSLLLTYWAHALLWATAAALLLRRCSFAPSMQHLVCKLALLAPLVSAPFSTVAPVAAEHAFGSSLAPREVKLLALEEPTAAHGTLRWQRLQPFVLLTALGVSGLGLLCFGGSVFLLARRIGSRSHVRDPALLERAERLRCRLQLAPIVLCESASVGSPLVVGAREICLPCGLSSRLSDAELDAVLAHELAHLQRADGVWFPIVSLLCSLFWFQPSNRWLAAHLRRTAELACDDLAVGLTRDPAALASALVRVAEASLSSSRRALVPAMRGSGHALVLRIERLNRASRMPTSARLRAWALASLGLVLLGTSRLHITLGAREASAPLASPLLARTGLRAAPPDMVAANARLIGLSRREHALLEQLDRAQTEAGAEAEGSAAAVRVLELGQELSHVRTAEAWLEQRFSDDWAKGETEQLTAAANSR